MLLLSLLQKRSDKNHLYTLVLEDYLNLFFGFEIHSNPLGISTMLESAVQSTVISPQSLVLFA